MEEEFDNKRCAFTTGVSIAGIKMLKGEFEEEPLPHMPFWVFTSKARVMGMYGRRDAVVVIRTDYSLN